MSLFIFEEYFTILYVLRKCAEPLGRLEDLIIKGKQDVNRSDIVEGKPKVTEKRRRLYVGREEKKAFVGLSSPRDKSILHKIEIVTCSHGTLMRH